VARAALELGFFVSFSGILTFRNADDLRQVAREVPLDRCLIETDSPYLAPAPKRGRQQPRLRAVCAAKLAEVKGWRWASWPPPYGRTSSGFLPSQAGARPESKLKQNISSFSIYL